MNIQEYITSGVIQDYCLGVLNDQERLEVERNTELYPEIKQELLLTQEALGNYVSTLSIPPIDKTSKSRIWDTLENLNLEGQMNIDNLPLINKFTDYKNWLPVMKPFLPGVIGDEKFVHVLRDSEGVTQLLVMSKTDYEDEIHDDLLESFIILEGECECRIGPDRVIRMKAGGYIDIPMHQVHDVKILSPYVVAIIQRIAA